MQRCAATGVLQIEVELVVLLEVIQAIGCIALGCNVKHAEAKGINCCRVATMLNECFYCVHVAFERG